jgi:gliding motility-associated-like protein
MKLRYILLFSVMFSVLQRAHSQAPIEFVENQGQWGDWFSYKANIKNGEVCLEKNGFRFILADPTNNLRLDLFHHGKSKVNPLLNFHVYKVSFEGANTPQLVGSKYQKVYYNYFLGNDPSRWKSSIHPCFNVDYMSLYNGIDMHVASEKGSIMYEFIVHPGSDVEKIKLKFEGQDDLRIKSKNLLIATSVGTVQEVKPYAYQYINDEKTEVPCEYTLHGNSVAFDFPEGYDHSKLLIIDPIVLWSTLTGSTADNWGYTATYDNAGDFYAGGLVNCLAFPGTHFPVSPGAFQTTWGGGFGSASSADGYAYAADMAIIKYNSTGVNRIYATYIGGNGNEHPHSMIVDASNNLIIAGRTRSTNYPTTSTAYQISNRGGWDIVVTKLNATGTGLVGSTYVGGSDNDGVNFDSTEYAYGQLKFNYGDDSRSEVQVDGAGNIYVASCTQSGDFPTTPTAISSTLSGMQDGVVIKLNPTLSSMLWSTYLGGNGSDAAYVLAFDTLQASIFVAGGTNSTNFPTTPGAWHSSLGGGGADGFIVKFLNSPPYNLQEGTYVGTTGFDQVYGIQVDDSRHVYVMGQSVGGLFPVTPGVYSNPGSCQFIMKMDNGLTTDQVSTVFGSGSSASTNISPTAFLVDTCGNVYVSGWGGNLGITGTATGLCSGMYTTPGCYQPTTLDGRDFYFIVLGSGMTTVRYATYFGRNCSLPGEEWMGEHVDGGTSRFSKQGIIYQGICANCGGTPGVPGACATPFPTTAGVWSMVDSSRNCNEAALKIEFNIGPVSANPSASPSTNGCAPFTVTFINTSTNGVTFVWDFGDGSTYTGFTPPPHTFVASGVYTVSLHASNVNACFKADDTAYLYITVDTGKITPDFTYQLIDSCGPYIASFANISTDFVGTPTYLWYLGDGSTYSGTTPPTHTYADTGYYTVMLIMSDPLACKTPDTITHTIHFANQNIFANFTIPDSLCIGTPFTPLITFSNVTSTTWTFGDGTSSTGTKPSHTYGGVGTYTVTLIAQNPGACKGSDTLTEIITIIGTPKANFSYTPTTPVANIPTTFTNLSVNATRYLWDYGDNTSGTEENPIHQYSKTGTYKVCLTAYNASNCPSVVCKQAPAEIVPLLGLPTAFSPNGDGENDILYVRGAAIKTLDLKIWNRWGQLVFETTDQRIGWDGTFNGQPQPIEAYAYVLNATFIDGTARQLKGNITLLR